MTHECTVSTPPHCLAHIAAQCSKYKFYFKSMADLEHWWLRACRGEYIDPHTFTHEQIVLAVVRAIEGAVLERLQSETPR